MFNSLEVGKSVANRRIYNYIRYRIAHLIFADCHWSVSESCIIRNTHNHVIMWTIPDTFSQYDEFVSILPTINYSILHEMGHVSSTFFTPIGSYHCCSFA